MTTQDNADHTPNDRDTFNYMLLSRLQSDCKYFLGNGARHEKHLWAGNVQDQISKMKELWNGFSLEAKPEWLSLDDILNYEKEMTLQPSAVQEQYHDFS